MTRISFRKIPLTLEWKADQKGVAGQGWQPGDKEKATAVIQADNGGNLDLGSDSSGGEKCPD